MTVLITPRTSDKMPIRSDRVMYNQYFKQQEYLNKALLLFLLSYIN